MVEKASTQNPGTGRFIAFYLPQFYPTPYNDAWWGKGFTEWTNVVQGRPRFRGHYQPHLPADLGFYDLRLSETREAQAELAKQFGVYGFCYYHYWFSGKRILERPLDEVLASGKPDFPFCICWANETWKKSWIGRNTVTLLEQTFSFEDDLAHIRQLLPVLADSRYIRIEGRPLLLVYRVELLPEPRKTAEIWRSEAIKAGLGDLFLVNVQSTYLPQGTSPDTVGFDAAVRFEPRAQPAAAGDRSCLANPQVAHSQRSLHPLRAALSPLERCSAAPLSALRMRNPYVGQHRSPAKKSRNRSWLYSRTI